MEIYKGTGVLKTPELKISKSIGSFIIASSRALTELTNELVTIWIERANGSNVEIATNIPLKDFIMLSTYGTEATQSNSEYDMIAVCEIADEGSVRLYENESLKMKLDGLLSAETYAVYGVEEPNSSETVYRYERKTIASEDLSKKINVENYELAVINTMSSIDTLSYRYTNGEVIKYLPFVLQVISADVDPIQAILANGSVIQTVGTLVTLPLTAVSEIEVNKSPGTFIALTMKKQNTI